jgi:hypothetical protein
MAHWEGIAACGSVVELRPVGQERHYQRWSGIVAFGEREMVHFFLFFSLFLAVPISQSVSISSGVNMKDNLLWPCLAALILMLKISQG